MTTLTYDEADHLLREKISIILSTKDLMLPVKTIDEVSVFCTMSVGFIQPTDKINFVIHSSWLGDVVFKAYAHTLEEVNDILNTVIPNLKYNKIKHFFSIDKDIYDLEQEILSHIPENTNIRLNYSDCCVCLDKTNTKTSCEHYLCATCESHNNTRVCPMCGELYAHYEV